MSSGVSGMRTVHMLIEWSQSRVEGPATGPKKAVLLCNIEYIVIIIRNSAQLPHPDWGILDRLIRGTD